MFGRNRQSGKGVEQLTKEVQARRRQVQTALEDLMETPDAEAASPIQRIFASFQGEFSQVEVTPTR